MSKKNSILNATLELIAEFGLHATPMSMVSQKAGVAAGTIYHYFDSKEVLLQELYQMLKERMDQAIIKNDDPHKIPKERFFNFWLNLFYHFLKNPQEFLFIEQYASMPLISKKVKAEQKEEGRLLIKFLEDNIRTAVLRNMPVELMIALIYGSVSTVVKLHLSGEMAIEKEKVQMSVLAGWNAIKAE